MLHEAVKSVPIGPVQTTEKWYAGRRLGVATLGFCVWGAGTEKRTWYNYFSRVLEKGSVYSIAAIKDLLTRLKLDESTTIVTWADCGRHFRCNRTVATIGYDIVTELRQPPTDPDVPGVPLDCKMRFGMPKHFKNPLDRYFGTQNTRISLFAQGEEIASVGEYKQAAEQTFLAALAADGEIDPEVFIDFVPPPRKQVLKATKEFTRASLCQPMDSSFAWTFHNLDKRCVYIYIYIHTKNDII